MSEFVRRAVFTHEGGERLQDIVQWEGPGWYASRQERGRVRWWQVGENYDQIPETYSQGLGMPVWIARTPMPPPPCYDEEPQGED